MGAWICGHVIATLRGHESELKAAGVIASRCSARTHAEISGLIPNRFVRCLRRDLAHLLLDIVGIERQISRMLDAPS
jgi:hypothetical protein